MIEKMMGLNGTKWKINILPRSFIAMTYMLIADTLIAFLFENFIDYNIRINR